VLEFLWAVHKNLIQPLVFSIDQCTESQNWASRLHLANIDQPSHTMAPPPFPLPPPPQAPAENLSALDAIAGDIRVLRETSSIIPSIPCKSFYRSNLCLL
jgi:hypothetical protein